jgi:hypothetical protein
MRALILAMGLALPAGAQQLHCGTAQLFRTSGGAKSLAPRWVAQRAAAKRSAAERGAAAIEAYRTLETAHFRISYTLAGVSRIKTVDADSSLLRMIDSLSRIAPGHGAGPNDAAFIDAKLDSLGAPHPQYALTAANFLEHARGYYVDTLGMHAPHSVGLSFYYQASPGNEGKYSVDIVDIGTAVPDFHGDPYYALTYPATEGSMLLDNDFLYGSRVDSPDGIPKGDTIMSQYRGTLIHNYGIDWEAGLKVTCFHEFYHAVQFTYTPGLDNFHVWYETSAVGMEERNATEVNDYLQYLPALFQDLPSVGMFNYPNRLSWYGNGIFHVFLNQVLGEGFDVAVWSRLAENGNDIRDALSGVGAAKGKSLRQLYADFAAQLAFSGQPVRPPLQPFSPDMPRWPTLQAQPLNISPPTAYQAPAQLPMTINAWKISGAFGSGKSVLVQDTGLVPVLAFSSLDSSLAGPVLASPAKLDFVDAPGRVNLLSLANGSTTQTLSAQILILQSVASTRLFAYPNPLRDGSAGRLYFSRLSRASDIRIFSESGWSVRSLSFTPDSTLWSWDLRDGNGGLAKPGVYYYSENGGPAAPVLLY